MAETIKLGVGDRYSSLQEVAAWRIRAIVVDFSGNFLSSWPRGKYFVQNRDSMLTPYFVRTMQYVI